MRVYTVRKENYWIQDNVSVKSKVPGETLRMRRLMRVRTILRMIEGTFSLEKLASFQIHAFFSRSYDGPNLAN